MNVGQPNNTSIDSPGNNQFGNNGFNDERYDLYNNSTITVYAQNNTWGVDEQTPEKIESVIYHKADDSKLGKVIYLSDEQEAGISQTVGTSQQQSSPIFNLKGARLQSLPKHGIYIQDGKKVIR